MSLARIQVLLGFQSDLLIHRLCVVTLHELLPLKVIAQLIVFALESFYAFEVFLELDQASFDSRILRLQAGLSLEQLREIALLDRFELSRHFLLDLLHNFEVLHFTLDAHIFHFVGEVTVLGLDAGHICVLVRLFMFAQIQLRLQLLQL